MKTEVLKETVIGGNRYQISKMSSETGSWLLFKLIDSLRKIMQVETTEQPEQIEVELTVDEKKAAIEAAASGAIQNMLMGLDEELFGKIQKHALSVCSRFDAINDKEILLPVLMVNTGRIAIPDLQTNIQVISALTSQALFANLSPFFLEEGFKDMKQS